MWLILVCLTVSASPRIDRTSACWAACLKDGYDSGGYANQQCFCVRRFKFEELIGPLTLDFEREPNEPQSKPILQSPLLFRLDY